MNIDYKKNAVKFSEIIAGNGSEVLAEADLILPENCPDIQQILQIDTMAQIKEKDVANDRIIFRGDVSVNVLYVPIQSECDMPAKSFRATAHFTDVCQASGVTADMRVQCLADTGEVSYTLVNSRKINVKAVVHTQFKAMRECESSFISDIESDVQIEKQQKEFSVFRQFTSEDFEITTADRIEFSQKNTPVGEILKVDVTVSGNDAKLLSDKCVAKGICHINTLYLDYSNGEIEFHEHELPFTEVLDIPGLCDSMSADIDYTVTDVYYETDSVNNEISAMGIEIKLSACVNVCGEENISILSDCYGTSCDIAMTKKECSIDKIHSVLNPQIMIKGDIFTGEGAPAVARVCSISAKPSITSLSREDNLININGNLNVCILYITNEIERPVHVVRDNIPFSHTVNSDISSDFAADCSITLESISYTLPGDDAVSIRACANAAVKIICKEKINVIDDISFSECKAEKKSPIVIYFVQNGDSLWEIAKKYKTGMEKISALNSISASSILTPGMKLLIPTS